MKNYTFLFLTIILFSCTSVEVQEFNDNELNIDENVIFLEYLENDWQKKFKSKPFVCILCR
jgi:hypothetical protein